LGIGPRHHLALVARGVLPKPVVRGEYELGATVRAWVNYCEQKAAEGGGAGAFNEARRRWMAARAAKAELELRHRQGELLERQEVEYALAEAITVVKNRLLGVGHKLGPRLARIGDPGMVQQAIDAEIYLALEELAQAEIEILGEKSSAECHTATS